MMLLLGGCASAPTRPHADGDPAVQPDAEDAGAQPLALNEDSGDKAVRAGDLELALMSYREALKAAPDDARLLFKTARVHELRGERAAAARVYRKVLEAAPEHGDARERLGLLELKAGRNEAARPLLEAAVADDPKRWRAHNALGVLADMRGEHAAAADAYREARALRPEAVNVINNLGYSHYLAGNLDTAEGLFRAAIDTQPRYRPAWCNLALVQVRRGEYDAALEVLGRVMERAEAHNNVGYLCMLQRDYACAERHLRAAITASPAYYDTAEDNLARLHRLRVGRGE